jgi:hypothetical protein
MATQPDRAANGRFAPGWRGGPGRPRRATEAQYLARLSEAVPLETWDRIVQKAVEDALAGDRHARAFLANYLIGRPKLAVEVSASGNDEIDARDVIKTVVEVLERVPGGDEIKFEVDAALNRLEKARGVWEPAQLESR